MGMQGGSIRQLISRIPLRKISFILLGFRPESRSTIIYRKVFIEDPHANGLKG